MRFTEVILFIIAATATFCLSLGYALEGLIALSITLAVTGIIWWATGRRFGKAFIPLGFFFLITGAAGGVLAGQNFYLMAGGLVSALGTWDLMRFKQRLSRVESSPETEDLARRHTQKLAVVLAVGAALSLLAASVEVRLGFWVIVGMGVILLISLQRALHYLKKSRKSA
jgi:hypothetical protein